MVRRFQFGPVFLHVSQSRDRPMGAGCAPRPARAGFLRRMTSLRCPEADLSGGFPHSSDRSILYPDGPRNTARGPRRARAEGPRHRRHRQDRGELQEGRRQRLRAGGRNVVGVNDRQRAESTRTWEPGWRSPSTTSATTPAPLPSGRRRPGEVEPMVVAL